MQDSLYRLLYVSRSSIGGDATDLRREVDSILEVARRNNAAAGITGALMFNARFFAQALEGSQQAIERIFENIQCDLRHGSATILSFEPIEERAFLNWHMACVDQESAVLRAFNELTEGPELDPANFDGAEIFEMLQTYLRESHAA